MPAAFLKNRSKFIGMCMIRLLHNSMADASSAVTYNKYNQHIEHIIILRFGGNSKT